MRKNISISPLIQTLKKDSPRSFDSLNSLDKRIAVAIEKAVVERFQQFAESVTENLTEVFFLGFYRDGGYVGVLGNELRFKSPIDKYQYEQKQVFYIWSLFWSRQPAALNDDGSPFVDGQLTIPAIPVSNSGPGEILFLNFVVNQNDGSVTCQVTYRLEASGVATDTNDGVLAIFAQCQRALG